jgi:hypothetical protein
MEMRHYPVKMVLGERAFALLTAKPPEVAAVFVHGFDGSPDKTWVNFEHLVDELGPQRSVWSTWDLFFYGYRSHKQIAPLAEDLTRFVRAVAARNERLMIQVEYLFPSSRTSRYGIPLGLSVIRGNIPYKHLFLVGHSTGAVIIRQAMCNVVDSTGAGKAVVSASAEERPSPRDPGYADHVLSNASLRFFAPAHLGVMAAGPLGVALSFPITDMILNSRLRSNPLYQTIAPGSPTLANLRIQTERLYEKHRISALKAYSVFGENEDIVFIGGYSHDEQAAIEKNQGHRSICKPTVTYTRPLEFVTNEPAVAKRA